MKLFREASQRAFKRLDIEGVWISPDHAFALRDMVLRVNPTTPAEFVVKSKLINRCKELERTMNANMAR